MVGGPLSDVRIMLCVIVGVKTGRKRQKKQPTEVVEGGRRPRENQNLEVSCTDFVHAWEQHFTIIEVTTVTCPVPLPQDKMRISPTDFLYPVLHVKWFSFAGGREFVKERPGLRS